MPILMHTIKRFWPTTNAVNEQHALQCTCIMLEYFKICARTKYNRCANQHTISQADRFVNLHAPSAINEVAAPQSCRSTSVKRDKNNTIWLC